MYYKEEVASGRPWPEALLGAIRDWNVTEERLRGRTFKYLIGGEAFDWVTVAERILMAAPKGVKKYEKLRVLFNSELPPEITKAKFKEFLGPDKFRGHLNFFYGVLVEEALMHAVELEACKETGAGGFSQGRGVDELVAHRLYGESYSRLLTRFRGKVRTGSPLCLAEWKGFVYWLHKLRLASSDGARTASDTKKGILQLAQDRDNT